MRRLTALTLITLLTFSGIAAQQALNYLIRGIGSQFTSDQLIVDFTVINSGAAVTVQENAALFDDSGRQLASGTVKPLAASESVTMALAVPLTQFEPGSSPTIYAVVGMSELPPANQRTLFGNIGSIEVHIPTSVAAATPAPTTTLPGGISLDWSDPTQRALVVGIVAVVAILLWVITVIVRLLFAHPPVLPAWQPPYVITPLIDPNSTNGRRQLWQQHAQSDILPAPCAPGNYMVRKLLIGSSGVKLAGWRVTGMRISQYDRYGRVARSQTVIAKGTVKALDRAVRKSPSLDWDRALRTARPIAKALTATVIKKTNKQSAILPIALEIRFLGMHGEVRILFELYGCNAGSWQEIDHWEPEMRVVNGSIQENFTYTLNGQHPQEGRKQYRARLQSDLALLLAAMVQAPPPTPPAPPPEDTAETAAASA